MPYVIPVCFLKVIGPRSFSSSSAFLSYQRIINLFTLSIQLMTVNKFTELGNYHHNAVSEHFHHPNKTSVNHVELIPIPTSSARQALIYFLSLLICLYWPCHVHKIIHYVAFWAWLLLLCKMEPCLAYGHFALLSCQPPLPWKVERTIPKSRVSAIQKMTTHGGVG